MSDEVRLAFAHPSDRAATMGVAPADRISLHDYIVETEIGAFQQERGQMQRLRFNVAVEVASATGAIADDVDRILSYDRITEAITAELAIERLNLLETLAERVALRILQEPQAQRVFLRIEKLDRGPFALGVEIVRAKDDLARSAPDQAPAPRPRVVLVTDTALAAPDLAARIDDLAAMGAPLILCAGAAATAPQATTEEARLQIALLSADQMAWVLATQIGARVAATRTEIDWAMRHGQISVWAPAKIVLDAVGGPATVPADPQARAAWFATLLGAVAFMVLDGTP